MLNQIDMEKSIISHDKHSDRIYLMKLNEKEVDSIIDLLEEIVRMKRYTKIFAKVPLKNSKIFFEKGYVKEAEVPNLYKGIENGLFLAKYFSFERKEEKCRELINKVIHEALKNKNKYRKKPLKKDLICRIANEGDSKDLADFYKMNFKSYPFPIFDYEYIEETMKADVVYFSIWKEGKIIAASSCEIDKENLNAEMTDFATDEKCRGRGLACYLLNSMEQEMKNRGIRTLYTIARAKSFGMNITFSKKGFKFSGTLINNTNISGAIESMNVWYKLI